MAVFAEDYYALLALIQNGYIPTVYRISPDFPKIDVNLNNRQIEIDKVKYPGNNLEDNHIYLNYFAVEGDHRSVNLYFRVDRYFEDIDLMNCTCIIEYINANNEARIYPVTLKDHLTEPGKILFAWSLGNELTRVPGTIQFAIQFYKMDTNVSKIENENRIPETAKIIYSLKTLPATGKILDTLSYNIDQEVEKETYYSEYASNTPEFIFDIIEKSKIHWNDL